MLALEGESPFVHVSDNVSECVSLFKLSVNKCLYEAAYVSGCVCVQSLALGLFPKFFPA